MFKLFSKGDQFKIKLVISNSYDNQKCDFSFLGGLGWPVEDPQKGGGMRSHQ